MPFHVGFGQFDPDGKHPDGENNTSEFKSYGVYSSRGTIPPGAWIKDICTIRT